MTDRCCTEPKPVFDSSVCIKLDFISALHELKVRLPRKTRFLAVKSRAETHCRQKCITRDPRKTRQQVRGTEKHYFNLILIRSHFEITVPNVFNVVYFFRRNYILITKNGSQRNLDMAKDLTVLNIKSIEKAAF